MSLKWISKHGDLQKGISQALHMNLVSLLFPIFQHNLQDLWGYFFFPSSFWGIVTRRCSSVWRGRSSLVLFLNMLLVTLPFTKFLRSINNEFRLVQSEITMGIFTIVFVKNNRSFYKINDVENAIVFSQWRLCKRKYIWWNKWLHFQHNLSYR